MEGKKSRWGTGLLQALPYCTITVIGAPCEIPPDVAVIVRFTFPRATPLVLPQPANPNTPTMITAARAIANRALRIHSKELLRCQPAAIENSATSKTQRARGYTRSRFVGLRCVENGGGAKICPCVTSDTATLVGVTVAVNELGVMLQVEWTGAPVQVNWMSPVKPPCGVTAT